MHNYSLKANAVNINISGACKQLATTCMSRKHFEKALHAHLQLLNLQRKLLGKEHHDVAFRSASASGLIRLAVSADIESFPWMLFVLRIIGVRLMASVIGGDDACTEFVVIHFGEESSTDGDEC